MLKARKTNMKKLISYCNRYNELHINLLFEYRLVYYYRFKQQFPITVNIFAKYSYYTTHNVKAYVNHQKMTSIFTYLPSCLYKNTNNS